MVDLLRIESFLHTAENLSFSEAARVLHLTQPTVSHHIKKLEQELGVELFNRQGSSIKLTDAGRLLVPWARKVIRDSIEMQEMMASLQAGLAGSLQVACSTTAGKYVLPLLAARFSKRHPKINISILRCTPESVAVNLLEGDASLGVVSSEIRSKEIELQKFFQDSITMIVPTNHPFTAREKVYPEDLVNQPIIMREETSGTRRVVLAELAKFDIRLDDLDIFMEIGNAEAIVRTVAAGYGISFISRLAISCPLKSGALANIPVEGFNLVRNIYMVRKRLKEPSRPQEAFWSFIHAPSNLDLIQSASRGDHTFPGGEP